MTSNRKARHAEYVVVQIEAARVTKGQNTESESTWTLRYLNSTDRAHLLVGTLSAKSADVSSQVMAFAHISPPEALEPEVAIAYLTDVASESLYDICRRAVKNQAALLDGEVELSLMAPIVQVSGVPEV